MRPASAPRDSDWGWAASKFCWLVRTAFRFLRLFLIVAVAGAILAGTGALLAPYGNQILTATSSVD